MFLVYSSFTLKSVLGLFFYLLMDSQICFILRGLMYGNLLYKRNFLIRVFEDLFETVRFFLETPICTGLTEWHSYLFFRQRTTLIDCFVIDVCLSGRNRCKLLLACDQIGPVVVNGCLTIARNPLQTQTLLLSQCREKRLFATTLLTSLPKAM